MMVEWVWTFERADQRLAIARLEADEGPFVIRVTAAGRPRQYRFRDLPSLLRFQKDMETFLLRTGWLLVQFLPDRRRGRDRRGFPRPLDDRRRWWTDGAKPMIKAVWGG